MHRRPAGVSLVELLITVVIIGILAATLLPSASPVPGDALSGAAQVLAGDLEYGRELAVSNNSRYRFTFDLPQNRYLLEHSGSDPTLNVLPSSPFRNPTDPPHQQIVRFHELPQVGANVRLGAAEANGQDPRPEVAPLEFGPLGETVCHETTVWLTAGSGTAARFVGVRVDPVTGIATIGDLQAVRPSVMPTPADSNLPPAMPGDATNATQDAAAPPIAGPGG